MRFVRWSDARIRSSLAGFCALTGRLPSPDDLDGPLWTGPSARTLRRRFGGVEEAGLALAPVPADVTGAEAAETPLEVALVGLMHG